MEYIMHLKGIEDTKQIVGSDRVKATVFIVADEVPDQMPTSGADQTVEGLSQYVDFASLSILVIIPDKSVYVWNENTQSWEGWV